MGWISVTPGHEGFVRWILPGVRVSSMSNGRGVLVWRPDVDRRVASAWAAGGPPTDDDMYDLVPYADVVGWEVACECGWTGGRWTVDETLPGECGDHDAEDSYLPDGRTVDEHGHELWAAHDASVGLLGAVEQAARAVEEARRLLDDAVRQARRAEPAFSWTEIGRAAGMTRQAAHERWASPTPTSRDR